MNSPKLFLSFALLAAGQVPAQVARAAPAAITLHVNGGTGANSAGCGPIATPCQTIGFALGKAVDGDTVSVAAGVYAEHSLPITRTLTLAGAGRDVTIIDAGGLGRVIEAQSFFTVTGLTLRNGRIFGTAGGQHSGGAIQAGNGLVMRDSAVVANVARLYGGGVYVGTDSLIERTLFISNTADFGGALSASAPVTVTESVFDANRAITTTTTNGLGGALHVDGGTTRVLRSALVRNTSAFAGGAVAVAGGLVILENVTASDNATPGGNGAIYATGSSAALEMRNTTVAHNRVTGSGQTGGIDLRTGSTASMVNSIVANNTGRNCRILGGTLTSLGNNIASDFQCPLTATGDVSGTNPLLAPLAESGGTWFHGLLPNSPAIDTASGAACPALDQRSIARPQDGNGVAGAACDIGAIEVRQQAVIAPLAQTEGTGGTTSFAFVVTLFPTPTAPLSLSYTTMPGSALAGSDFTASAGTLNIPPGQVTATIPVSVAADTADEADEQFALVVTPSTGVDVFARTIIGTIVDDDGLGVLTMSDAAVVERDGGLFSAIITATLSPASATPVTVSYATVNGTAVAGADYNAQTGQLVFTPGVTAISITLTTLGDELDEADEEKFTVVLSNPINANLADDTGEITIIDDDVNRVRTSNVLTVTEGNDGIVTAPVTVTLDSPASFTVTVRYELRSFVATAGVDYIAATGTLTFAPGVTLQTFVVQVLGDNAFESNEQISILFSDSSVPFATGASSRAVTIINDDPARIFLPHALR